jgi:hypothetical protein
LEDLSQGFYLCKPLYRVIRVSEYYSVS